MVFKNRLLIILMMLASTYSISGYSQVARVSVGKLMRYEAFSSKNVANRNIDVWLPDGYSKLRNYPVLYLQDGQMLFDSSSNWNKKEWQVDETIGKLISENKIRDCIVVGIWNTGEGRHADYFPQRPFESLPKGVQDSLYGVNRTSSQPVFNKQKIRSDFYLKFIVTELKPFIDREYSTLADKANTFIGGSSMGGLISLYAICEYPSIFGGAICMSTHWPGIFQLENNPFPPAMLKYLKIKIPSPRDHRIYFDHGDKTLDAWYAPYQRQVDLLMRQKKYSPGKNWITRFFPGEEHSENAWARRLSLPVIFMLGKP